MNSNQSAVVRDAAYSTIARLLHWVVAALIVVQVVLAKLAERAEDTGQTLRQLGVLANHKSVGITVLVLVMLRLIWRARHTPPALPASMPAWQVKVSRLSHWSFYLLLIAVPLSGWLMSSASAYSVSWFNLLQLPDLVPPNADWKQIFEEIHEILARVLLVLAVVHVMAAFKHLIIDKDGVMRRMFSTGNGLLFVVVIIAGVAVLGRGGSGTAPDQITEESVHDGATRTHAGADPDSQALISRSTAQAPESASQARTETARALTNTEQVRSALSVWNIDYRRSYIRFTAEQAGADFTGEWPSWSAHLQFSNDALARSRFDVTINTTRVDTRDAERDAALADPDWFDVSNFPQAYYRANRFSPTSNERFVAHGSLIVKGQSYPVDLEFTVSESDGRQVLAGKSRAVRLDGSAKLDRLKLRIGTGEWRDTSWVGQMVQVDVRVEADVDTR